MISCSVVEVFKKRKKENVNWNKLLHKVISVPESADLSPYSACARSRIRMKVLRAGGLRGGCLSVGRKPQNQSHT